ncbi:uncharacterized protein A4U43_UnF5490 [Asparagus officinalis]|uniref:O-methyltransferase domain-containing protein n=1 Tax=Asparagus officinalis TaxID=4686 RepID=A0A1R3L6Q4_ASPOF|nr:tabersonine 16-O-methyltransferase-like [Asparagus officinalis]ONK55288.1 uncharacterized protein A4U43_UnF5490 [Asparagus officinalis]
MEVTEDEKISSDEFMRAEAVLWTHMFNHIDSMSLKCAIELGIPDAIHLHGKPISLSELLSALSISPSKSPHLRRLMRLLTHLGIFAENEANTYSLTSVSIVLVGASKAGATSLSGFVLTMLHPVTLGPFQSMSTWFKSEGEGATPFSAHHGCDVWGVTQRNPSYNEIFNEGMASDVRVLMKVLLKDCKHVFEGLKSLVDVGGGTGSTAMAIAEAFPAINCSVLELPQVVSTVKEKGSVEFIAGDMFDHVPPANAVLLKWILHDWTDEDCVRILKRCKEAVLSKESDGGGGGGAAGFTNYKITPALGLRSVIELYP